MNRPTILLVCDHYAPAFKAGGPVRSLVNLVTALRDEFSFRVLTRDHDSRDPRRLPGIEVDRWTERDGHAVRYLSARGIAAPTALRRALVETPHDLLYLNSFFSPYTAYILTLRRAGLVPRAPLVVTPRGELADAALRVKSAKKRLYLALARAIGLYRGVLWHATSEIERDDIARRLSGEVALAANVPGLPPDGPAPERPSKRPGALRVVCLARVARNKNLEYALRILARARGEIDFDLWGTSEDPVYLAELRGAIDRLPPNVRAEFRGEADPARVLELLADYHLFLFPSRNESFGHAILEALLAGLPVLISDGTFWRGLAARGVGYDLPLDDEDGVLARLHEFVALDETAWRERAGRAAAFARDYVAASRAAADHRALFRRALAAGSGAR